MTNITPKANFNMDPKNDNQDAQEKRTTGYTFGKILAYILVAILCVIAVVVVILAITAIVLLLASAIKLMLGWLA